MRSSLRFTRFVGVCAFLRLQHVLCSTPSVENTSKTHLYPLIDLLYVSDALVHPALNSTLRRFVPSLYQLHRVSLTRITEELLAMV